MEPQELDGELTKLAALAITVGANLQKGQELIVTAPIEAAVLVHHITKAAYVRGAKLVTCLYEDPVMIRHRFEFSADEALEFAPEWLSRGISKALLDGAARVFVAGPYPELLNGIAADKILKSHSAMASAFQEEGLFTAECRMNWTVIPFVTSSWAAMVFPKLPVLEATNQLWRAVFDATRVSNGNAVDALRRQISYLDSIREVLQTKGFDALHFYDGRTDICIGLVPGHRWVGGSTKHTNGVEGVCNIPSEELFTCPYRTRADGSVFCSRPLAIAGARLGPAESAEVDGSIAAAHFDQGM